MISLDKNIKSPQLWGLFVVPLGRLNTLMLHALRDVWYRFGSINLIPNESLKRNSFPNTFPYSNFIVTY